MIRYLPLLFLLCSCSASYHLRRAQHHIEKAKELGATVKGDTVVLDTTIYIPSVRVDTVVNYENSTDTLVVEKDHVKIRFRDLPGPTVYLSAECPPDTIHVVKKKYVPMEISAGTSPVKFWLSVVAAFILGIGLTCIVWFFSRRG